LHAEEDEMEARGIRRHRVAIVGGGFGGLFAAKRRGPSERVITAQQVFERHALEAQAALAASVPARSKAV